jgi:hypothetical protein
MGFSMIFHPEIWGYHHLLEAPIDGFYGYLGVFAMFFL